MDYYQRRLPHWHPPGRTLFITWHLSGSLPRNRYPPSHALSAGQAFVWMDRYLDQARFGPTWLTRAAIAQTVVDSLHFGAASLQFYDLHAYVVMANHVHVLIHPNVAPAKLLQSVKGFSSREANKLLGRTGEPFWQSESYDHWVRDGDEFRKIRASIENNPVRAGLVENPEDYPWSSASTMRGAGLRPAMPPFKAASSE